MGHYDVRTAEGAALDRCEVMRARKQYLNLEGEVIDAMCRLTVVHDTIADMGMNDAQDAKQADKLIGTSHILADVMAALNEAIGA